MSPTRKSAQPQASLPIRDLQDLGQQLSGRRKAAKVSATDLCTKAGGISRNTLHRIENGLESSTGTLLSVLKAMGYTIELVPMRKPTLEEMRARFADDANEEGA
jgi:transcriptional regulator with XRE-family HTH domain